MNSSRVESCLLASLVDNKKLLTFEGLDYLENVLVVTEAAGRDAGGAIISEEFDPSLA